MPSRLGMKSESDQDPLFFVCFFCWTNGYEYGCGEMGEDEGHVVLLS